MERVLLAGVWIVSPGGAIRHGIALVQWCANLGVERNKPRFGGRLVLRPTCRNRVLLEGIPYSFSVDNAVNRRIVSGSRTFHVQDRVTSKADITYVLAVIHPSTP